MPNPPDAYRERLSVPLRWWVQATMLLASFWLAFVVAMPLWVSWLATGVLAALCFGLFLAWGTARVEVVDGELRAGGARIDVDLLGEAVALDKDETRRVHGVDADARAFLVMRPYLKRSVQVPVADPADPTPYWLISSRQPRRLAAAIAEARSTPSPRQATPG